MIFSEFSPSSNMLNHDYSDYSLLCMFYTVLQCFNEKYSPHLPTSSPSHPTCIKIFSPEHIGWSKAVRFRDVSQTFPNKPCNVDWTPEETEMRLQSFWIVITMGCSAWWYWNYQNLACVSPCRSAILECLHLHMIRNRQSHEVSLNRGLLSVHLHLPASHPTHWGNPPIQQGFNVLRLGLCPHVFPEEAVQCTWRLVTIATTVKCM